MNKVSDVAARPGECRGSGSSATVAASDLSVANSVRWIPSRTCRPSVPCGKRSNAAHITCSLGDQRFTFYMEVS